MDGTSMAAKASSDSTVSNGLISSLVTMYLPATLSFKTWIFSLNSGNFTFCPPFRSTVNSNCSELKWNGIILIILVRMYERSTIYNLTDNWVYLWFTKKWDPSKAFHLDFILISSWFYPDFILILTWFYPNFFQIKFG